MLDNGFSSLRALSTSVSSPLRTKVKNVGPQGAVAL